MHALDYHRDIHDESFGRGLSSQFVRDSRAENVFWVERTFVWEKRYCLIYLAIVNGEASSIESPQWLLNLQDYLYIVAPAATSDTFPDYYFKSTFNNCQTSIYM